MSGIVYSGSMDSYFRHCADENARERELYRQQRDDETRKRGCAYVTGYGLPWTETCGAPVVGKWHAQDDEWFCATHIRPSR